MKVKLSFGHKAVILSLSKLNIESKKQNMFNRLQFSYRRETMRMEVIVLEREIVNVTMWYASIFGFNLRNELVSKHSFCHITAITTDEIETLPQETMAQILRNQNKPVKMKIVGMCVYSHGKDEYYLALEVEIDGFNKFRKQIGLKKFDAHIMIGHMWEKRYRLVFEPKLATWLKQANENNQREKAQKNQIKRKQRRSGN